MRGWIHSFFSKLTLGLTVATGAALTAGVLPPQYAAGAAIGLAVLQAFQPKVQHSGDDIDVSEAAIKVNNAINSVPPNSTLTIKKD